MPVHHGGKVGAAAKKLASTKSRSIAKQCDISSKEVKECT